ncbi:MAG: tetratricopeptide repeat protein, partial [Planctomycetota bacterium]
PNIIPVHELGHDPMGRPYMAMKFVKGHNLQELILLAHKKGRTSRLHDLQRERMLETFMKVCDAISYAHARGVIHRDLKPENVMVGEFGEVLLMDWGLAKPLNQPERLSLNKDAVRTDRRAASPMLTMQGEVFGTPGYMSPEQANGLIDEIDERVDVFGLGTILYEILTHHPPYEGKTVEQVLERAAGRRLPSPRRRAPKMQIPKELDAITMKALEKDPRRRYRSAEDLRRDIEAWLGNDKVIAYTDSPFERLSKWARRNPTRAMVGSMGALFIVITLASIFVAITAEQGRRAAQDERDKVALAKTELEKVNNDLVAAQAAVKTAAQQTIDEAKLREVAERNLREKIQEQAEVMELARKGEIDKLRQRLGISERKDKVVKEFRQRFDAFLAQGRNYIEFFQQMSKEQVVDYIKAFEDLIKASEEDNQRYYDDVDMANLGQLYTGAALFGNGREMNRKAIEAYRKAIDINPNRADYWVRKAGPEVNIGMQAEAIDSCNHALALNPQQLDALFSRGLAYWYTGEKDKGIADFETALRLQPALADFRIRLYDMLVKSGRKADADRMLREGLQHSPNHHNLLAFLGQVALQDGKIDEAVQVLGRLHEIAPDDFTACALYGSALMNAQRNGEAIPVLQAATRAQGATWEAWRLLGIAQANTNDPGGAVQSLREAWRRAPNEQAKAELAGMLQQLGASPQ